jgi:hypothetical protein
MGKIFGSREHAPINVAGTIIVLGMLGMFGSVFVTFPASFTLGDMEKLLGSFVLAALTFLAGYLGAGRKDE